MTSDGRIAYVYVTGEGSGPARLAAVLDGHPEIASAGAVSRLDRSRLQELICSCGCAVADCPFWIRVLAGLAARNHGVPAGGFYTRSRGAAEEAGRPLAALAASTLDVSGKRVFLDASGKAAHLESLLENPLIDLHVVSVTPEAGSNSMARFARGIQELSRTRLLTRIPAGRRIDLDLASFDRDAFAVLGAVYDFLGLDSSTAGSHSGEGAHLLCSRGRLR